jgi:hypothetical protein
MYSIIIFMARPSRDRPKFAQSANADCDEDHQKQLFDAYGILASARQLRRRQKRWMTQSSDRCTVTRWLSKKKIERVDLNP